jgi:hypothetical protein
LRRTLLCLVLGSLAAGCGSGSEGTQDRETWAREANAICQDSLDEVEAFGEPTTAAELAALVERTIPIFERSMRDLRALSPPEGFEAEAEEMLDHYAEAGDFSPEILEALKAGNEERAVELSEMQLDIGEQGDAIAADLGATACTKEPFESAAGV